MSIQSDGKALQIAKTYIEAIAGKNVEVIIPFSAYMATVKPH